VADIYWYPVAIWTVLVFCFSMFAWERGWIPAPLMTGLEAFFIAWLGLVVFSALLSAHHWSSISGIERIFVALMFFYLMLWNFSDRQREKILLWSLFAMPVLICMVGLAFYLAKRAAPFPFLPNIRSLQCTFVNHNNLAGMIILGFFLGVGLTMGLKKSKGELTTEAFARVAIMLLPLGVLLIALGFSLSRSGWIAAILAGMAFLLYHGFTSNWKRFRLYLGPALALITAGIIASLLMSKGEIQKRAGTLNAFLKDPSSGLTLSGRKMIWHSTMGMIGDHPLVGVGPGNYWLEYPRYRAPGDFFGEHHAHNDLLQLAAETGVISSLIMVSIFGAGFVLWRRRYRHEMSKFKRRVSMGVVFGMLGFILQDQVDFHFYIPGLAFYFLALAALMVRPRRLSRHD